MVVTDVITSTSTSQHCKFFLNLDIQVPTFSELEQDMLQPPPPRHSYSQHPTAWSEVEVEMKAAGFLADSYTRQARSLIRLQQNRHWQNGVSVTTTSTVPLTTTTTIILSLPQITDTVNSTMITDVRVVLTGITDSTATTITTTANTVATQCAQFANVHGGVDISGTLTPYSN